VVRMGIDRYQCQALRFEGDRCTRRIEVTVTTGEWMEITEWHLGRGYPHDLDFDDIITVDGRSFSRTPGDVLMPGDMVLINTVSRAWCDECAAGERRLTDPGKVLIIKPLTAGDHIPSGSSQYCVNGYDDNTCDMSCGRSDHEFHAPEVSNAASLIRKAINLKWTV
jgi:hypothetical protein